jgi:hypothetical protein
MTKIGKIVACALCLAPMAATRAAVPSPDKTLYECIVSRNVFDLKHPVPSAAPEAPAPSHQIRLTGITTILGGKVALLMVQDPPAQGRPAGKEDSYILREKERQGSIEVLRIDEEAQTVTISDDGKTSELAFAKVKLPDFLPPAKAAAADNGSRAAVRVPFPNKPGMVPFNLRTAPPTPPQLPAIM